jgi:dTDP-4-dehydrorhamnose reductase
MTRSLIVGASGQVGHQICQALGAEHAIGTFRSGAPGNGITLDLRELLDQPDKARALIREVEPDAVYCAGAMTHVDGCESEPKKAMEVNCFAPSILANAAAEADVPFVFFSTEYVFDGKNGPYSETAAANPISVYGRSKWMGENAVRRVHPNALILRTTVVYGFDPAGKNFLYSLRAACLERRTFRAPVDQISTPTYNKDLASAAIRLVKTKASGVFHVCGRELLSRYDFAIAAIRAMGLNASFLSSVTTAELKQVAPRPLTAGLLTNKLTRALPDLRMRSVEEGLREWMAENPTVTVAKLGLSPST